MWGTVQLSPISKGNLVSKNIFSLDCTNYSKSLFSVVIRNDVSPLTFLPYRVYIDLIKGFQRTFSLSRIRW